MAVQILANQARSSAKTEELSLPTLNQYRINYPDGGRQHVKAPERDKLLLAGLIEPEGNKQYRFIGQVMTLHSLADLTKWTPIKARTQPNYYPGQFIIEHKQKRTTERLESPEALAVRVTNSAQSSGIDL